MKQLTIFKRSLSLSLCVLLLAAAVLGTTGCSNSNSGSSSASGVSGTVPTSSDVTSSLPQSSSTAAAQDADAEVLGEGETIFALTVTDGDGKTTAYQIHTDETTVGAALQSLGLIEGEESEYGLYVKSVCGITADYDTDGAYWAFYIDGEYASTGVDSTEIVPGSSYALRVEKG